MMIGTELFRQRDRAGAMTLTGIVNWAATFVIAVAFEPLQVRYITKVDLMLSVLVVMRFDMTSEITTYSWKFLNNLENLVSMLVNMHCMFVSGYKKKMN